MNKTILPWHFEAYRRYTTYEVLQQAAAALVLFENESIDARNPEMDELLSLLEQRTGLPWLPDRKVSESINFNIEGDIYRNKGRLLSSLFIVEPKSTQEKGYEKVMLTPFGRALGNGFVSKEQFYEFIIKRFKYPHPAFEDNWSAWKNAKRELRPFIFLLQILVELYMHNRNDAFLTSEEVASIAYPLSDHRKIKKIADKIIELRKKGVKIERKRSDAIDRKIDDVFGFLCIAGYAYYDGRKVALHLLGVHPEEKAWYWEKRRTKEYKEANTLKRVNVLIKRAGGEIK